MVTLTDPEVLTCYYNALRNWHFEGYVVFMKDAAEGLRKHLDGYTQKGFKALLHKFVVIDGSEIDQVVEGRENWRDEWSHHYDLRLEINGVRIYVETRLSYTDPSDPDDPVIYLANIKPA
jgi:hypothetical protein